MSGDQLVYGVFKRRIIKLRGKRMQACQCGGAQCNFTAVDFFLGKLLYLHRDSNCSNLGFPSLEFN